MQDRLLRRLSRREVIRLGIGASLFIAGGVVNRAFGNLTQTPDSPAALNTLPPKEKPERLINQILSTSPFTDERKGLENQYFGEIVVNPTVEEIDKGLWVSTDLFVRSQLLDARYELRKRSILPEIPQDKNDWSFSQKIHPEILGICLDNYARAKGIIQKLIDSKRLRDDEVEVTADEAMINPGGMASLIATETAEPRFMGSRYAFTFIGEGLSVNELNTGNPNAFPTGIKDLETLCKEISENTGFTFFADKIVGSVWPDKKRILEEEAKKKESERLTPEELKAKLDSLTTSGGAISIQFMPNNALKIYNLVRDNVKDDSGKPIELNVFDVNDATVMAWVYLARHERVGDDFRYGYRRNQEIEIKLALAKWNPNPPQIEEIYETAVNYYNKFLNPNLVEKPYDY